MELSVSTETMRRRDKYTCDNLMPSRELMKRAGVAVFEQIRQRKGSFALLCGRGNNAGDGYVIAHELHKSGRKCKLFIESDAFSSDGEYYFTLCKAAGVPYEFWSDTSDISGFDNALDCIYGIGFHGELSGNALEMVRALNQSSAYVISVDINSGLDANSGLAKLCVISDLTLAVGYYKHGHFLGDAKDVIGSKDVLDIGIPLFDTDSVAHVVSDGDLAPILRKRAHNSHKGDYGYVTLMGGCTMYSGALKLANLALCALKCGCGVSRLACPRSLASSVSPYMLESTLYPLPDRDGYLLFDPDSLDFILKNSRALALGMGWGRGADNARILEYVLKNGEINLLIDADGLNTLAELDEALLRDTRCSVILTPHPKEFSRLCKRSVAEILDDPVLHACEYAQRTGVTLLLKGCATVVTDGRDVYISDRGCPGMASAGSGDLLSGALAGLLGYNDASPLTAVCASYLCGLAGELASKESCDICTTASDSAKYLSRAVGYVYKKCNE